MNIINNIIIKTIPLLPKNVVKLIADNYVAGIEPQDVLNKTNFLNKKGYEVTIDLLGEHTSDKNTVDKITQIYLNLLKSIKEQDLRANISVKPTHIGLDIDLNTFSSNAEKLVSSALKNDNFIRFDMENSSTTDSTINIIKELNKKYENMGTVFQAYLKRSYSDLSHFLNEKTNFRLCKGIYNESSEVAYKDYNNINKNYLKIVELAFKNNSYICFATHDLFLIDEIYKLIDKYNVSKNKFEFQVLYGVPMKGWLQKHLKNNYKVRVYLPYGPEWYEYSIRRLKENPNIAKHVAKSLFSNRKY
jgi:proline dehydrogenase